MQKTHPITITLLHNDHFDPSILMQFFQEERLPYQLISLNYDHLAASNSAIKNSQIILHVNPTTESVTTWQPSTQKIPAIYLLDPHDFESILGTLRPNLDDFLLLDNDLICFKLLPFAIQNLLAREQAPANGETIRKNDKSGKETVHEDPVNKNTGSLISGSDAKLKETIYQIAQAAENTTTLETLFPRIHAIIKEVMLADNFFIALLDPTTGQLSFPYSADQYDSDIAPMDLGKTLTAYVIRTKQSLLCNADLHQELVDAGEVDFIGTPSKIWLGVPLLVHGEAIGAMVVQDYNSEMQYSNREQELLEYVSTQIAASIQRKRIETSLHLQTSALNSAANAVVITDVDGQILWVNQSFQELTGYTPKEVIGKTPRILKSNQQNSATYQNLWQTIHSGKVWQGQLTNKRKDGSLYKEEQTITPVKRDDGTISHFVAIKQDITKRLEAEQALRHSEERFRSLYQNMQDAFISTDIDGRVTGYNPAFLELLGYTPEELEKLSYPERTPEIWHAMEDEIILQQVMLNGFSELYEKEYLHKDGSSIPVELRTYLQKDNDGTPIGLWAFVRDIRARKHHEKIQNALAELSKTINLAKSYQALLNGIIKTAVEAIPLAEKGSLTLLNGHQQLVVEAAYGYNEKVLGFTFPETWGYSGKTLRLQQPILIPDVHSDPKLKDHTIEVPHKEVKEQRCILAVPLSVQNKKLGTLLIESSKPDVFTENDLEVAASFATQASLAIENAGVQRIIQQQVNELQSLFIASNEFRKAQTVEQALPILLDQALLAVNAENGELVLYNPESGYLESVVARGWFVSTKDVNLKPNQGIGGKAFSSGKPYMAAEFFSDPTAHIENETDIPSNWGGACIPLHSGDKTIGVMFISVPSQRRLTDEEIRLLIALAEVGGIAIHRMHTTQELRNRVERLSAIHAIEMAVSSTIDHKIALDILTEQIVTRLKIDAAAVLHFDPYTLSLSYSSIKGFQTKDIYSQKVKLGQGIAGQVAANYSPMFVSDIINSQIPTPKKDLLIKEEFINYYALPLISKGKIKGVLELFHRSKMPIDTEWIEYLETLAQQAAIAIDNSELLSELQRSNLELVGAYDATIEGWSLAMDLRDEETEDHTRRVTKLTIQLAQAMEIDKTEIIHIRRGALLHDIGKIGIPDAILLKPGKLSEEEWALMRKHPVFAYNMLVSIEYLRPAIDIPYCHHEKWDGTGYPRGLAGEQIPLSARIFSVIDVYDALTSNRPYRPAWSKAEAVKYIQEQSGIHFDPKVVETFVHLYQKGYLFTHSYSNVD